MTADPGTGAALGQPVVRAPWRVIWNAAAEPQRVLEAPPTPPDLGLISCLMVTGGRTAAATRAVTCFRHQTYPNRELVIVDDSGDPGLADAVAAIGDDRIRMLNLPSHNRTLGDLRNVAVAAADGAILCQWDDDDLSDPDRLTWQAACLAADPQLAAVFLERWLMWWPGSGRLAVSTRRVWEGSMLVHREQLPPYPTVRRGEDSAVVTELMARSPVASLDLPQLYCYVVHGANTFPSQHFEAHWDAATVRFPEPGDALAALGRRLPVSEVIDATFID